MARISLAVGIWIGVCSQEALAIWLRTHSVEWWTNISDTIAEAEVVSTKKLAALNEYYDSQEEKKRRI
jgi:hypothetical protein